MPKTKKPRRSTQPDGLSRPKTSYLQYQQQHLKSVRAANPDWKQVRVVQELGRMWREASSKDKAPFIQKAKEEFAVYREKRDKLEAARRKDAKPTRPYTAYVHFHTQQRGSILDKYPETQENQKEVFRKAGELWRAMDAEARKPYTDLAARSKKEYAAKLESWHAKQQATSA